jgi:Tol biopolymer transport system component
MLAGQPPLTGATPQIIQARRMSETPSPLHDLRDTVPTAMDHVIARALARIPADRYATASQFAQALQAAIFAATPTARVEVTPPGESLTSPGSGPGRRWRVGSVVALVCTVVTAGALWILNDGLGPEQPQFTVSNIRAVTSEPGLEFQPAISPDGNEVAYVVGPLANPRVVVRSTQDVGRGGGVRLGDEASGIHWLPAWAPGGASVRFLTCQSRLFANLGSDCAWKEVSKFGGSVRTVGVPRSSNQYAWSPDGTRVVFSVWDSIFVSAADHGEPELLAVQTSAGGRSRPHSFAWSPDGRQIAYVNRNRLWQTSTNVNDASIWVLDAGGGEPVPVTDERSMNQSPQWLPDSRHLVFVSNRDGPRGVYVVEVGPEGPQGSPRSVLGASDPHSISISAGGRRLAYARLPSAQNIWSIPIPRSGSVSIRTAVQVTEGNQVTENHSLSRDGEWIVFDSNVRGGMDIYKQRVAAGSQQLVADLTGNAYAPAVSPDGTEIAFYSGIEDADVFVVSADGGTSEQLTDGFPGNDIGPAWSPDGLSIAYQSQGPDGVGLPEIWIVSRDSVGGPWSDPAQLTDFGTCQNAHWAPDGASLVCFVLRGGWLRVSREGEVLMRYDPSTSGLLTFPLPRFSPDGSRIYFRGRHEDGSEGIWWIPAAGGDATKVVAFDYPSWTVFGFLLTVGPENLYLTINEYESDIWVMDLEW